MSVEPMEIITLPPDTNHSVQMGFAAEEIYKYAPYISLYIGSVSLSEIRERRFFSPNDNIKDYFNINKRFELMYL